MELGSEPACEDVQLQKTLNRKRKDLEGATRKPAARWWLRRCADSEAGTDSLLQELETFVDRDFEQLLRAEREKQQSETFQEDAYAQTVVVTSEVVTADGLKRDEVFNAEWWEPPYTSGGDKSATTVPEETGDYILVYKQDAIDALASFIAAYIISLPEGRAMEPQRLQQAVKLAIQEIRKGRARRLWDWGRNVYRAAALGYGAFAAYTNPWVAEAVLRALFTCARFLSGTLW